MVGAACGAVAAGLVCCEDAVWDSRDQSEVWRARPAAAARGRLSLGSGGARAGRGSWRFHRRLTRGGRRGLVASWSSGAGLNSWRGDGGVLNHGMLGVNLLGLHAHRPGGGFEARAINDRARADRRSARSGRPVAHSRPGNGCPRDRGNALNRDAAMHKGVIHNHVVVNDGGLAVDGRHPGRRQAAGVEVMGAKVAQADKEERIAAQGRSRSWRRR